jgi:hypothetical protein
MLKSYVAGRLRAVAKIFAEEMVREMSRVGGVPVKVDTDATNQLNVRLDVVDVLTQLAAGPAKARLVEFYSMNHRWVAMLAERNRRTASATYDFIESEMNDAIFTLNQFTILESKRDAVDELSGEVLDLGVFKGNSTRALARLFPDKTIHGFDSFEGLPDDWSYVLKGTFGEIEGRLPDVPENVQLYKGWFEDTLPVWAEEHSDSSISLLRIDCDIYSSTKAIFDSLGHLVSPGTWLLFDELIGYRGWRDHEYKAFEEFLDSSKLEVEYVAYGLTYVLVRLS